MKISFFTFMLTIIFLYHFPLFSQEGTKEDAKKWYFYIASGQGSIRSNTVLNNEVFAPLILGSAYNPVASSALSYLSLNVPDYKIPTTHHQIGGEYRYTPFLFFGFGLTNSSYIITNITDQLKDVASLLLFNLYSQDTSVTTLSILGFNLDYQTLLIASLTYLKNSVPRSIQTNTADASFNLHFLGNGIFDPYIGVGGSYGYCSSSFVKCTAPKFSSKVGFQVNLSSFYFFFQGEIHYLIYWEKAGHGGIGVRF